MGTRETKDDEERKKNLKFHLTLRLSSAAFHALSPDDDLSLIILSAVSTEKQCTVQQLHISEALIVSICPHIHQINVRLIEGLRREGMRESVTKNLFEHRINFFLWFKRRCDD
jgi:hypothetical protein